MRFGTVAIIGRSNVGKSTFLNAAIGERLAVVSPRPQTTRERLLGIAALPDAQVAFLDTPGVHRPKSELGRRMNATAFEAARSADVTLLMTDVEPLLDAASGKGPAAPSAEDAELIASLPKGTPSVLAINKVDRLRNKARLLPLIEAFSGAHAFAEIVPLSLLDAHGAEHLLRALVPLLPAGDKAYADDTLTDRPSSFFVREYVREQVLALAKREVPHAVAVSIERISESGQQLFAEATIHVEKVGQRKILVGHGGQNIRAIGTQARLRLQQLLNKPVVLKLFVRVTPRWRDSARLLAELGYEGSEANAGERAGRPKKSKQTKARR